MELVVGVEWVCSGDVGWAMVVEEGASSDSEVIDAAVSIATGAAKG